MTCTLTHVHLNHHFTYELAFPTSCLCARALVISEFEDSGPSFKNFGEDELKRHLHEMWELMYSKARKHTPSKAASLVSLVFRRVPLLLIRQLLLDNSFQFTAPNIRQVLEKCGIAGIDDSVDQEDVLDDPSASIEGDDEDDDNEDSEEDESSEYGEDSEIDEVD